MGAQVRNNQITIKEIQATAERVKNWGRWGPDDEICTLNNISPEDIVNAARLIRRGKVFSLGLNFDNRGPQTGLWGNRFNPIHTMLTSGVDARFWHGDPAHYGCSLPGMETKGRSFETIEDALDRSRTPEGVPARVVRKVSSV
jgi:hypothetical protein